MRGLFTKIFLCFWIAQSLTMVISTGLILRHHFAGPEQWIDAFNSDFSGQAVTAANVYENLGCPGLAHYAETIQQKIYLSNASRQLQCSVDAGSSYSTVLAETSGASGMQSAQVGKDFVWSTKVISASGHPYLFLLVRPVLPNQGGWVQDLWHFAFPQLPVAIVVFGAFTFILVSLLTRPIAQLRVAAGQLAKGQLSARVSQPDGDVGFFGGDEIQKLVHDFNHMAERLESLMAGQRILLRDVSHELRTPLTRLCVTLELAREDAPASMTDYLARIEKEAACVTSLIEQLLRLSSMESANVLGHTEVFSFTELLEQIVPNAEFEARQRACQVELQSTCECSIEGIPALLYQAVENVVRNAIRYTKEGSTVELNLRCEAQGGQQMMILEVGDDGPGIPDDEMKKIFLPFYRVDDARQRDTGGFGVGLAIAERAVRLHHGEIIARNRAAGGLVVTLKIPCHSIQPGSATGISEESLHRA